MTWDGDLREQVLAEFRDAQRRRGELDSAGDEPRALLAPPSISNENQATPRVRRIIARPS